jgi:hypothetical protein
MNAVRLQALHNSWIVTIGFGLLLWWAGHKHGLQSSTKQFFLKMTGTNYILTRHIAARENTAGNR